MCVGGEVDKGRGQELVLASANTIIISPDILRTHGQLQPQCTGEQQVQQAENDSFLKPPTEKSEVSCKLMANG